MALTDPEKSKSLEKFIFEANEIDEAMSRHIPEEEIKFYPGSDKGPLPEDDPDSYAKWLVDH